MLLVLESRKRSSSLTRLRQVSTLILIDVGYGLALLTGVSCCTVDIISSCSGMQCRIKVQFHDPVLCPLTYHFAC